MNQNRQSSIDNQQSRPKRQRLSQKQLAFLNTVFESGQPVTDTLRYLCIRPGTLNRWLTKPPFLNRLRMYLNQYCMQARLELTRSAPMAIASLSFLSEKSLKHKEVRQACTDILTFYRQMAQAAGSKQEKTGAFLDNFGKTLEQFGDTLDNNGNVLDQHGNTKTHQNALLDTKNTENNKSPHLIAVSAPNPDTEHMNNIDD